MSLIEPEFVHIKCYGKINRALAGAESLFVNAELFANSGICVLQLDLWPQHLLVPSSLRDLPQPDR